MLGGIKMIETTSCINDFNDTDNICMCETCKYSRELNLKDNNVRCAAKSYLASWRHLRRRKCKHYKKLLN